MKYIIHKDEEKVSNLKTYTAEQLISLTEVDIFNRVERYFLNMAIEKLNKLGKQVSAIIPYREDYWHEKPGENTGYKYWYFNDLTYDVEKHIKNPLYKYVFIDLTDCLDEDSSSKRGSLSSYINIAQPWYIFQSIQGDPVQIHSKLRWLDYKGEEFTPLQGHVGKRLIDDITTKMLQTYEKQVREKLNHLSNEELVTILTKLKEIK